MLGYRVIDVIVDHFEEVADKPVTRTGSRSHLERLLREPVPEEGSSATELLQQLETSVFGQIMHLDHPRFFAFVPGPSNFVSVMADALAAGFNVFAGTWLEASGPAQLELVTIDWLREVCGLPDSAGGLFVSGGSMANLTALAVARHMRLGDRGEKAMVYCSDQTHSSIERGMKVLGFRPEQLRTIDSDADFRLDVTAVADAIEADRRAGCLPFCVIANAGTTNTGAVDPLPAIASLCEQEDLWFHIDGAYGAAAALCSRGRPALQGLHLADSLALDPHKWLFQPYEIGCLLVRNSQWLTQAFRIMREYLIDIAGVQGEVNFCDHGIQLTRGFRALKLWMSLKLFGRKAFEAALNRGFELAETVESVVQRLPDWRVVTPAQMGIVTFRYAPEQVPANRLNGLNRELVKDVIQDGFAMVSTTVLRDCVVVRMCTINPRTTESDIHETLARLDQAGRTLRAYDF